VARAGRREGAFLLYVGIYICLTNIDAAATYNLYAWSLTILYNNSNMTTAYAYHLVIICLISSKTAFTDLVDARYHIYIPSAHIGRLLHIVQ